MTSAAEYRAFSAMLTRVQNAFRALRHRNLRLFFAGQGVSLVGTWMQQVAMAWLVYRLTDSELLLGVIAFAGQFPGLLMAPFAGALAERWGRHRLVIVAQTLLMLQAAVVALLVVSGRVQVWHLIALAVFAGLINGADIPARQSLLVRLVGGTDDLPNAIALNSSMFNGARLVGPGLGGLLIGWVGEGPVFVLNAVSYVAVLAALTAIRLPPEPREPASKVLRHIGDGFAYAFGHAPTRDMLAVFAVISLVGVPYVVLLPAFARDVLGGDARTLGLLTSCAGLGAFAGALRLAARDSLQGIGRLVVRATAVFGLALVAFSASRALWLSCALLVVSGFGLMIATAGINTVIQTLVSEQMRVRVMSLYAMAFVGVTPLGSLAGGALATRLGAPVTVALGGAGCLVLATSFGRRLLPLGGPMPSREEAGVLAEVAGGLQTASELRPRT
ncbi:MAG: MFS transporter [Gemmatimonadales bacterium]